MEKRDLIEQVDAPGDAQGVISKGIELLRELAGSQRSNLDELRHRAQLLVDAYDDIPRRQAQRHGHLRERARAVDAWILDIFGATERAIPRETLVEEFLERYRKELGIGDEDRRHGPPWLFIFETEHEHGKLVAIHGRFSAGVHPEAFRRLCDEHLPQAAADPFLGPVLHDEMDIDGWHALWFGGSPLFDRLVDTRKRFGGEADYWVNGVLLPGNDRYESLAVFILHPNAGDLIQPEPPPNMRQDQRLLIVLALAWRQLEHQIKSLAALTEADRREFINLIAPGLLHHEIGALTRTLYSQAFEQFELLKQLALASPDNEGGPIGTATRYAHTIGRLAIRLHEVTEAFNNMEKRTEVEDTTLTRIVDEIELLLTHRLDEIGASLEFPRDTFATIQLHTDTVLLEHALLNILNNALNALEDGHTPFPRRIRIYMEREDRQTLTLAIVNNGPRIAGSLVKDIFRRGFTTRRSGHGQGLYLARLVAHYLGGDVTVIEDTSLPDNFKAGFRVSISPHLASAEGLSRVAH